jgi:hypothetical protein
MGRRKNGTDQTQTADQTLMKTQAVVTSFPIKDQTFRKSLPAVRKRLFILSALLGLIAGGTGVAAANDFFNGNGDILGSNGQNGLTPNGWTVDASKSVSGTFNDGASSETFANVCCVNGHGLFYKPFQGTIGPPANDLLTVNFYQDNATTPGTKVTLSGYAAGEANYCGRFNTNSPAPQTLFVVKFLDSGNNVLASNVLDLVAAGLPVGTGGAATLFTTPQFTAPAGTVTVRAGASMLNAYGTTGGQAFIVDALDLESVPPPGSPVITNQPAQTTVRAGATTSLKVGVSNPAGASYQWILNGINLADGGSISGATNQTLTITGVTTNDVGHYRVRVSNSVGTVISADTTLTIVGIAFTPVVLSP